ncbi:phage tail protein [Streptomyces sp. NPDC047981]|uniref:phage tail protein n=1 Tax=Streptomyces sp. NPDC047981 TaxID=3154610 RepID=UPI00341AD018
MVSFDGTAPSYFSELSGITSEIEPVEYIASNARDGNTTLTKQFGKTKPPTVTLKRGVDGSGALFAWHVMARAGAAAARMSGTLSILGHPNSPGDSKPVLAAYMLTGAWPSKVEVGNLKAGASEVVLESVTFTCESIQSAPLPGGSS